MTRFDLDLKMELHSARWAGEDSYYYWHPREKDQQLIAWLDEHVGQIYGAAYRLPLRGNGWFICEGFSEDDKLDDYSWRYVIGLQYKPKGLFGIWLEVEDDKSAVALRLSSMLDGVVWDGERPHYYTSTSTWRSNCSKDYPKHFFR